LDSSILPILVFHIQDLKEAIRIQQIRDIFGIRAVEEIKQELTVS